MIVFLVPNLFSQNLTSVMSADSHTPPLRRTFTRPLERSLFSPLSLVLAVFLLVPLLTGCLQTSMLPAHQLDTGESALSASLNVPPSVAVFSSGVSGQFTTGLAAEGDLSINVSASPMVVSGGIAPRLYLSDNLNAQVQLRGGNMEEDFVLLSVAGMQTLPSEETPFYLGVYGGALSEDQTHPLIGARVGLSTKLGSSTRLQIEVDGAASLSGGMTSSSSLTPTPVPGRISIGISRLID